MCFCNHPQHTIRTPSELILWRHAFGLHLTNGVSMTILRKGVAVLAFVFCISLANAQQAKYTPALDVTAMDRSDRSVRRFLRLLLRRLGEEQSNSARPVLLGYVLQNAGREYIADCAEFSKPRPLPIRSATPSIRRLATITPRASTRRRSKQRVRRPSSRARPNCEDQFEV